MTNLGPGASAIDHEARSLAQRASDRQDAHERFCEERARKAEAFERDLKQSLARLHKRMDEDARARAEQRVREAAAQARLSTRQNILWAAVTAALVFAVNYLFPNRSAMKMNPMATVLEGLSAPLFTLIDELFTSDDERNAARAKILQMQQDGKLRTLEAQMSAILAEARSSDKWTSRARPGFLYVVYIFLLAAIPMGFLSAWDPNMAIAVTHGVREWLAAIPDSMWGLFGVGYLGYAGVRSWDKKNGVAG